MADIADDASNIYEEHCEDSIKRIRTAAAKIDPGKKGDCGICEEPFDRTVSVFYIDSRVYACAGCRDKFKLG